MVDIILGLIGAVVGGFIFNLVGASGLTGFNVCSMLVRGLGAVVVLDLHGASEWRGGIVTENEAHAGFIPAIEMSAIEKSVSPLSRVSANRRRHSRATPMSRDCS